MARTAPRWLRTLAKIGALLLIANEVRGIALAFPVLYALWNSGGTWMAIWLAFCSLAGIALSVAVPWWIARRLDRGKDARLIR